MAIDFESLANMPFRWLEAGDQLFAEADERSAALTKDPFSRMVFMMEGYKQAADLLIDKAIQNESDRPLLVYPILFCYRQCLELSLKYVITVYGGRVGVAPNNKDHDLGKLWPHLCKVLEHCGPGDRGALEALKTCIGEFAKVDPSSFTFRYATDTKGILLEISISSIGFEQLRETMTAVANYFTGLDGYLDDLFGSVPEYYPSSDNRSMVTFLVIVGGSWWAAAKVGNGWLLFAIIPAIAVLTAIMKEKGGGVDLAR